jgi:hypothetical protein
MVRQILPNNNEKCYRNFFPKNFTTKRGRVLSVCHLDQMTAIFSPLLVFDENCGGDCCIYRWPQRVVHMCWELCFTVCLAALISSGTGLIYPLLHSIWLRVVVGWIHPRWNIHQKFGTSKLVLLDVIYNFAVNNFFHLTSFGLSNIQFKI